MSETSRRVLGNGASGEWASIGRREAVTLAREVDALEAENEMLLATDPPAGSVVYPPGALDKHEQRIEELEAALRKAVDEGWLDGTEAGDEARAALAKGGK